MSDPFSTTTQMAGYGSPDPAAGTGSPVGGGNTPTANSASSPADASREEVGAVTDVAAERAENVKEKVTEAALAGKQAVGDVAETATEKAHDVVQEASRQARDLVGEAKAQVSQQAGDQYQKLVAGLRSIGEDLAAMARSDQEPGVAGDLAGHAQVRVQKAADWLEGRKPGDLVNEVRSFARQRPGAFLLAASFAGVLAGRMTRGVVAAHSERASGGPTAAAGPLPSARTGSEDGAPPFGVNVPPSALDTEVIGYSAPPQPSSAGYGSYPPAGGEVRGTNGGGLAGGVTP